MKMSRTQMSALIVSGKILKSQRAHFLFPFFLGTWFGYFLLRQLGKILFSSNRTFMKMPTAEHTRDKQIQRDDEYYDGDNDNDQNMDDWCVDYKIYLCIISALTLFFCFWAWNSLASLEMIDVFRFKKFKIVLCSTTKWKTKGCLHRILVWIQLFILVRGFFHSPVHCLFNWFLTEGPKV